MIPKIIHYCWFGPNEKTKLANKCIDSWRMYCSDYRIIEWNEQNFDIYIYPYAQYCYENKKYAFLSDFVRLLKVYEYGGIYFDVDVEVIRNIDDLLMYPAYFGFENKKHINTGLGFGAEKENPIVYAMLNHYLLMEPDRFGNYPINKCPQLNTEALVPYGLKLNGKNQQIEGAQILSKEYLNPLEDATGVLSITENTYSINWYGKSWMDKKTVIRSRLMRPLHRVFGVDAFKRFRK